MKKFAGFGVEPNLPDFRASTLSEVHLAAMLAIHKSLAFIPARAGNCYLRGKVLQFPFPAGMLSLRGRQDGEIT